MTPLTPRARVWSDPGLASPAAGVLPCGTVPNTESSIDLAEIFEPIRDDLDKVEQEYARQITSRVEVIPQIGKYLQNSGGKRIRPALLLMAARLAAYRGDHAVLFASVVEFIHTATLVHDDIIDDSELRRGRAAVHARWGNEITVLLGDYLYIKSMGMALTHDSLDVIRQLCDVTLRMIEGELYQLTKTGDIDITEAEHFDIIRRKTAYLFGGCAQIGGMALTHDSLDVIRQLCDVTLRMIEGELYQLTKTGDVDITEAEHFDIVRRKTAYLFGGCAQIGGMLGGVPKAQAEALREYGFNLGIAFQLIDDLLDYTAAESELGKPIGSDLREGKVTLPIIYLLQRDGKLSGELVRDIVRTGSVTPDAWRELTGLLTQHRAIDSAYDKARECAELARGHLHVFPPSRELEALMALPDYVLSRER